MENLFGKGLSAYPSNWNPPSPESEQVELGSYVEVLTGPYAELRGVVTYLERDYAWVRLDGDAFDLRFRRDLLRAME
jgi:transcription antitermination factor NusG